MSKILDKTMEKLKVLEDKVAESGQETLFGTNPPDAEDETYKGLLKNTSPFKVTKVVTKDDLNKNK